MSLFSSALLLLRLPCISFLQPQSIHPSRAPSNFVCRASWSWIGRGREAGADWWIRWNISLLVWFIFWYVYVHFIVPVFVFNQTIKHRFFGDKQREGILQKVKGWNSGEWRISCKKFPIEKPLIISSQQMVICPSLATFLLTFVLTLLQFTTEALKCKCTQSSPVIDLAAISHST